MTREESNSINILVRKVQEATNEYLARNKSEIKDLREFYKSNPDGLNDEGSITIWKQSYGYRIIFRGKPKGKFDVTGLKDLEAFIAGLTRVMKTIKQAEEKKDE